MKIALTPREKLLGAFKYLSVKAGKRPLTVSIEVTKRCNARCSFCGYWQNKDRNELASYVEVVRKFDPLIVVITGGEPLLRPDLVEMVANIKQLPGFRYMTLLTNGWLLSEEKVRALVKAGINQINVSMNYPDARQDQERGLPGLFEKLSVLVPKLAKEGVGGFTLSAMVMRDNMRDLEPLARLAHQWGVSLALSGYNAMKTGDRSHFPTPQETQEFEALCKRLKAVKHELHNILVSDFFFDVLPDFYARGSRPGCGAGKTMIHLSPEGMVKPCAELPPICDWKDFDNRTYPGVECGGCADSCRIEPEAPLTLRRVGELFGLT
jgi:MoaA/NifB/PqqE/SkfB family radical SAM enzyme